MSKRALLAASILLMFGTAIVAWHDAGAQEQAAAAAPQIIGSEKCNICHKQPKYGNQAAVWEGGPHAKAFQTLAGEAAKKIAAEKGIADPQKDATCLGCHTTQGFLTAKVTAKPTYTQAEGVGCEACHGAGSAYSPMTVMKDPAKAKAAGLAMPGKDHCTKCHNEKSPTFKGFDFEKMWPKVAHPGPNAEAKTEAK